MKMMRLVSSVILLLRLNKPPINGSRAKRGISRCSWVVRVVSKPPMAKLSPLFTRTSETVKVELMIGMVPPTGLVTSPTMSWTMGWVNTVTVPSSLMKGMAISAMAIWAMLTRVTVRTLPKASVMACWMKKGRAIALTKIAGKPLMVKARGLE